jgi:hypothetical protein
MPLAVSGREGLGWWEGGERGERGEKRGEGGGRRGGGDLRGGIERVEEEVELSS